MKRIENETVVALERRAFLKNGTLLLTAASMDVSNHYGVKNAAEVRKVLEDSGKVLAVFQGHNHINDVKENGGIHYCTLVAMVEGSGVKSNGYSVMSVASDGTIRIKGYRKQDDYTWGSRCTCWYGCA